MIHELFLSHLWTIPGSFLSYPWTNPGPSQDNVWINTGTLQDHPRVLPEPTLAIPGLSTSYPWTTPAQSQVHPWVMSEPTLEHRAYQDHPSVIPKPTLDHPWVSLNQLAWTIPGILDFICIQGIYPVIFTRKVVEYSGSIQGIYCLYVNNLYFEFSSIMSILFLSRVLFFPNSNWY